MMSNSFWMSLSAWCYPTMPPHSNKSQEGSQRKCAVYKNVQKFKEDDIDLAHLSICAQEILQQKPFDWQLEIAAAVLCGKDVIVDVGTGSGKTMCFVLPTFLDRTEIVVLVSPLTALMIDQVNRIKVKLYICLLCVKFIDRQSQQRYQQSRSAVKQ